jgi:hypothetical protein
VKVHLIDDPRKSFSKRKVHIICTIDEAKLLQTGLNKTGNPVKELDEVIDQVYVPRKLKIEIVRSNELKTKGYTFLNLRNRR